MGDDASRVAALRAQMEQRLGPGRFRHSVAVAEEAVTMADLFGGDRTKVMIAGLIHDCAKDMAPADMLALAEKEGLLTDPAERENPSLLHGPVGAWEAPRLWGVADPVILDAVRYHTFGAHNMSLEACIIFMADLIEEGRDYNGVHVLRQLCREDLQAAMIEAIEQTFVYLERVRLPLHGGTLRCLDWLKKERGISWKARI